MALAVADQLTTDIRQAAIRKYNYTNTEVDTADKSIDWVIKRIMKKPLLSTNTHPDHRFKIVKILNEVQPVLVTNWNNHLTNARKLYRNFKKSNHYRNLVATRQSLPQLVDYFIRSPGTVGNPPAGNYQQHVPDVPNYEYLPRSSEETAMHAFYHSQENFIIVIFLLPFSSQHNTYVLNADSGRWHTNNFDPDFITNNRPQMYEAQYDNLFYSLASLVPSFSPPMLSVLQALVTTALAARLYVTRAYEHLCSRRGQNVDTYHMRQITALVVLSAKIRSCFRTYGRNSKVY